MLVGVGIGKNLEGKEMKMLNPPIYIFDLDGTIAHIDHRKHFIEGERKSWSRFYKACVDDTPTQTRKDIQHQDKRERVKQYRLLDTGPLNIC
jgi:hypothetical protein